MAERQDIQDLREELYLAREELANVKLRSATVISGTELLVILCFFPMGAAFVALSIIIVWRVTQSPAEVGPFLDIILLALAVVANPGSAGIGMLMGRYSEDVKTKKKKADKDEED